MVIVGVSLPVPQYSGMLAYANLRHFLQEGQARVHQSAANGSDLGWLEHFQAPEWNTENLQRHAKKRCEGFLEPVQFLG